MRWSCAPNTLSPSSRSTRSRLCCGSSAFFTGSSIRPGTSPRYARSVNDHRDHSTSLPRNVSGLKMIFVSTLVGTKDVVPSFAAAAVTSATRRAVSSASRRARSRSYRFRSSPRSYVFLSSVRSSSFVSSNFGIFLRNPANISCTELLIAAPRLATVSTGQHAPPPCCRSVSFCLTHQQKARLCEL